ncbi:MAG TPA: DinB family protein, partial [Armatimonadota bacterium]|nr:DinB family protein [Armatimonadota bacterium]
DATRKEDRRAPFRSVHGTLNHLLLADRIWMGRFTGVPFTVRALDQELFAEFEELRRERTATDERIAEWAASLTDEALAVELSFTSIARPQPWTLPLWFAVHHFFNHQTHHRGQLTTLLEQLGCDYGVTDLLLVPGGPTELRSPISPGLQAE